MLCLESLLTVDIDPFGDVSLSSISDKSVYEALPEWGREDVFYALFCLEQAGYIDSSIQHANNVIGEREINYMTFSGHEFLESIRDDMRWSVVKKGLSAVRNYSLSAISSIAEGVTSAAISSYLAQK